jgi:hypothetical protein
MKQLNWRNSAILTQVSFTQQAFGCAKTRGMIVEQQSILLLLQGYY